MGVNGTYKTKQRSSGDMRSHTEHLNVASPKRSRSYTRTYCCLLCKKEIFCGFAVVRGHLANHSRYKRISIADVHDFLNQMFPNRTKVIQQEKDRWYNKC